jgi:hypothetical protein
MIFVLVSALFSEISRPLVAALPRCDLLWDLSVLIRVNPRSFHPGACSPEPRKLPGEQFSGFKAAVRIVFVFFALSVLSASAGPMARQVFCGYSNHVSTFSA